jgi:hypothetical protein
VNFYVTFHEITAVKSGFPKRQILSRGNLALTPLYYLKTISFSAGPCTKEALTIDPNAAHF